MVKKRRQAYWELVAVIVIWGIASVVIKYTLDGIAPIPFLTYRFLLSSIFALPFLGQITKLFRNKWVASYLIVYGILTAPVALGILFLGLTTTSVVNLSLVQSIEPLLLAYIAHKIFHDRLSKRGKIGVFLALTGAIITLIEPLATASGLGTVKGNLLLFVYISSDLVGVLMLKKMMKKKVSALAISNLSFILGFISFAGILVLSNEVSSFVNQITHLDIKYHLGVWYMALFSGTIAYALRARAQKTLSVTEVSIFGYLSPIISTILAIIFLNEVITPLFLLGASTIFMGVVLVEYKRGKPQLIK